MQGALVPGRPEVECLCAGTMVCPMLQIIWQRIALLVYFAVVAKHGRRIYAPETADDLNLFTRWGAIAATPLPADREAVGRVFF